MERFVFFFFFFRIQTSRHFRVLERRRTNVCFELCQRGVYLEIEIAVCFYFVNYMRIILVEVQIRQVQSASV